MYKVYTIFDKIAGEGTRLFLSKNDEDAGREFQKFNIERKAYNPFHKPENYTILCLALYYNDIQDSVRIEVKEGMPYDLQNIKNYFDPTIYDSKEFEEYKQSIENRNNILQRAKEELNQAFNHQAKQEAKK